MRNSSIALRYHIYNSLFLNLPFTGINRTGTLLPIFAQEGFEALKKGQDPEQIVHNFFSEYLNEVAPEERLSLLFHFIQYIERQVVLFDAVEDAAFPQIYETDGKGSIKYLLSRISTSDQKQRLLDKLRHFSVRLVLTAHPTQFYPGKVLGIITDLADAINRNELEEVNLYLMQLGKTPFVNKNKPTPLEEAANLRWFLENVFFNTMPAILHKLLVGIDLDPTEFSNPGLLRLGFWPGGDRDGNPYVTSETTLLVAEHMRQSVLRCYYRDIRQLRRRLTFRGIEELLQQSELKIYHALYYPDRSAYTTCAELIADLQAIRKVLVTEHESLFLHELDRFLLSVRMFGFYFASIDIRQDSRKHTEVWHVVLSGIADKIPVFSLSEYQTWSEGQKIDFLRALKSPLIPAEMHDAFASETISSFLAAKQIQTRNGDQGCHRYIISNCQNALNVIEVLTLARLSMGIDMVPLDIVPLFETIDDLATCGQVMQYLYQSPAYQPHLASRGNRQTIMLGFSDGTKDGGYVRANWSIYQAKEMLSAVSKAAGIEVVFFDGRGGPPGRGGGNAANFYASLGPEIADNEIQITIQGQTVSSNYGAVPNATYHIEHLLSAGLENHIFDRVDSLNAAQKALIDTLADEAYQSYLKLKNSPQFVPYLEQMTPLRWFGDTNIASRPTKRNAADLRLKFEDLRAIPFVGAWAQMKQNIPGFYGFGEAIATFAKKQPNGSKDLQLLYRDSLFFRTLVENAMMALSKSNFDLTKYLERDPDFAGFWHQMHAEYQSAVSGLLEISGSESLMAHNPMNQESIKVREEMVIPLILIQQYGIWMQHQGHTDQDYSKLVLRAMFGIINAARNAA
jgi:phosphoenolpyruvate carboxylase